LEAVTASDRLILFATILLVVLVADWGSKLAAEHMLGPAGGVVYNPKSPALWAIPVALFSTTVILLAVSSRAMLVGLTLLTGGCMANLVDRIVFGPVVDFIHMPDIGGRHYVANLADIAIFGGALILVSCVIRLLAESRRDHRATVPVSEQVAEGAERAS
jgi:lipoprotein signal peptidase